MWRREKVGELRGGIGAIAHQIGLDSLFWKTKIMNPEKQTIEPVDALKDTAFELEFWKCQILNQIL